MSFIGIGFLVWNLNYVEKLLRWGYLFFWIGIGTVAYILMPVKNSCNYMLSNFRYPFLMFCTALSYPFAVLIISKKIGSQKILEFLGRNSLAYYAVGIMVERVFNILLVRILKSHGFSQIQFAAVGIVEVVLVIVASGIGVVVFNWFYEMIVNWLKRKRQRSYEL